MNIKQDLLLFPCNGNALEALDCIDDKEFNILGFIDDDKEKINTKFFGLPIFDRNVLQKKNNINILAVPGSQNNYIQKGTIIDNLYLGNNRFVTIIDKSAKISPFSKIGNNCLIMEGVTIKANAIIEDNVCILPNTIVHHDSIIKKNNTIGSQVVIAGRVVVNSNCYIGSGSKIINDIEIGSNSLIGLGSVVIRSTATNAKMVGNPAKNLNR